MTTHPIRRLLANAANRGWVCFNDMLYAEALIVLIDRLERRKDELPPFVRLLVESAKKAGELV